MPEQGRAPTVAQLEDEIRRLKVEIASLRMSREEAERAKNEYMQNVAHQLAAPINAIKMNIESLENPRISVERKRVLLRSIYAQGTILAHLIKNFSLMSHLEAEHSLDSFRETPEDVDLYLLCVNFANDFQPMGMQKNQRIQVLEEEFTNCRRPRVRVIRNLFAQVIYNLLENATKYADADSSVTIGLRVDAEWVCTTVTSSGAPVSAEDLPLLFDRGFRGVAAKALHPAGTGFGLFIAKRVMEVHGGDIRVETNQRRTTFFVRCPKRL